MMVIICGSRSIISYAVTLRAIKASGFEITHVISGAAPKGPDQHGIHYAKVNKIRYTTFPAQWAAKGNGAGIIRNRQMAMYVGQGEACIAVWDGVSSGTRHMIEMAEAYGLKVHIHKVLKRVKSHGKDKAKDTVSNPGAKARGKSG